jgi:hypothetical protein
MAFNRYYGNSGRVERIQAPHNEKPAPPAKPIQSNKLPQSKKPPTAPPMTGGSLGGILSRLAPGGLETEDILLMLILYLLYRESGDEDFLIMLGSLLLPD